MMRHLLFMPCDTPPPLWDTLRSAMENPFVYHMETGFRGFKHSAFVLIVVALACMIAARMFAYSASVVLNGFHGLTTVIIFIVLMEVYRRAGIQCTLWLTITIVMLLARALPLLNAFASSKIGNAAGLGDLHVVETVDPAKNCMRLAACRASPTYIHHKMAQEKIDACERCAAIGKLFKSKWRTEAGGDVHDGYECSDTTVPVHQCDRACEHTRDALELIGSSANVTETCEASNGELCFVARDANGATFGYAGEVPFDSSSSGLGYPTRSMCEQAHPSKTCTKLPACVASDNVGNNCYCEQYKHRRSTDPCEFLLSKCDTKSPLYVDAKTQLAQKKLDVSDIMSAQDAKDIVAALDNVLGY